jgi:hypothetical protein
MHPLLLIARASKGDRRETLDLVKADKLFLHDRCTEKVIKDAELRNDHSFLQQLARAQNYRSKLRVREIQHLYVKGGVKPDHGGGVKVDRGNM